MFKLLLTTTKLVCYFNTKQGVRPSCSEEDLTKKYAVERRSKSIAKSGKTSTAAKAAYNAKSYKRYQVYLRVKDDADLIDFIEQHKDTHGTTELFRAGLEKVKNEGLN